MLERANWHDLRLTESTLASLPPAAESARQVHLATGTAQSLCLYAGYDYAQAREVVVHFGYTAPSGPTGS